MRTSPLRVLCPHLGQSQSQQTVEEFLLQIRGDGSFGYSVVVWTWASLNSFGLWVCCLGDGIRVSANNLYIKTERLTVRSYLSLKQDPLICNSSSPLSLVEYCLVSVFSPHLSHSCEVDNINS